MHVQGTIRETETRRIVQVINAPAMKTASMQYEFLPRIMEITFRRHEAPEGFSEADVKVSGPIVLEGGEASVTWTSRRFLGDLGIDGGARWIRPFVENFRPHDIANLATDTLHGDPSDWS